MKDIDSFIRIEKWAAVIQGIILLITAALYWFVNSFTVENVYVEGNEHYSAAEIREFVDSGFWGNNTIYLSLKYRNRSITDIPFIEKMDVDVVNKNSIKITVYEKTLAGYVQYLGNYIYFDKDGIVVESSNIKTEGIPYVSGLAFDHFVMYESLPVENSDIFQTILNVTQLLNKYEMTVDKIFFDEEENMTLYFDDVRVGMGQTSLLEEKVQRLDAILPELKGKSGYLEMSTYDDGNEDFTFTFD